MTDRERLLEQVEEAQGRAWMFGGELKYWIFSDYDYRHVVYSKSRQAAHHALTALALRDAIDLWDVEDDRQQAGMFCKRYGLVE